MRLNLFSIPFYVSKIDPSLYNKSEIIDIIEKNYNKDPNRNKWSTESKLHHLYNDISDDFLDPFKNESLVDIYNTKIKDFLSTLSSTPDLIKQIPSATLSAA